jgi:hypothetical protein
VRTVPLRPLRSSVPWPESCYQRLLLQYPYGLSGTPIWYSLGGVAPSRCCTK